MTTRPCNKAPSAGSSPLTVAYRPLDELKPAPNNPRRHSKSQIKQIARSIDTFGYNVPVLINGNKIIAGHGRVAAAKLLGMKEVPTVQLDHLSPDQMKAFMIADNRLTDTSDWDDSLLAAALKDLATVDLNFDLEAIGFDMGEIDMRIESSEEGVPADDADDVLDPSDGPPVSRVGDMWLLSNHRLLCGDASEPQSYERVMNGLTAAAVVTDPPYNIRIAGFVSGLGQHKHADFVMAAGEMSPEEFSDFLFRTISSLLASVVNGALLYLFMDWRSVGLLLNVVSRHSLALKNICTWGKNQAGMGSFYRSQTEFCVCCRYGNAGNRNNVQLGKHGRHRSNLWSYPSIVTERRRSEEGDLLALHSTVKPVAMIQDIILDCTARREVVLDPFLGSGTTLIAAQRCGRRCMGIELDPRYVDTAIRRWERFTGEQAVREEGGKTFAHYAANGSES